MTLLTERYGKALRTAIARDVGAVGPEVWTRFVGRREGTLWYYRAVTEALEGRVEGAHREDGVGAGAGGGGDAVRGARVRRGSVVPRRQRGILRTRCVASHCAPPPWDSPEPRTLRDMQIRPILGADRPEWLRMRRALWPGPDDHPGEIAAFFDAGRGPAVVFLADREAGGALAGFIELSLRSYAEGCHTSPVPYVEGWWVDEDARRAGVGRALVEAGERWARELGHTEMASDAAPDNAISLRAHAALGFVETDRVVCFRKGLGGG